MGKVIDLFSKVEKSGQEIAYYSGTYSGKISPLDLSMFIKLNEDYQAASNQYKITERLLTDNMIKIAIKLGIRDFEPKKHTLLVDRENGNVWVTNLADLFSQA